MDHSIPSSAQPPPPLTEEELQDLVRRAQDGDTEAFGSIYDHFIDAVYRYAAFRLPVEVAEDTVSDVFVKAWQKLALYKPKKNVPFGAWLFRIARHAVIDTYRAHRGFEEIPETLPDADVLNRAEARFERRDTLRIVRAALDKLPRRYREVLLLTFVSDLPVAAVAGTLGLSEGGVRILKMRALRKLESLLPPEMGTLP